MSFCEKCGQQLAGEKFCPSCGNEISNEVSVELVENNTDNAENVAEVPEQPISDAPITKKGLPNKFLLIAAAVVVAIVVIVIVALSNSGPNFKSIYKEHCSPLWASVGSDGSFLSIDTNPDDEEDNGIAYYAAYTAVETVNKELKLPDSLFQKMGNTTGADGKQSEEFDKIIVSWKYHPNAGLEVTYKKK